MAEEEQSSTDSIQMQHCTNPFSLDSCVHIIILPHKIKETKHIWVDRLNNLKYPLPDTIGGKAVSFYLNNPNVSNIAKLFYKGKYRPTDNDSTTILLSYVTTNDSVIRPFYRWSLDFIILISDGALGEYPGTPAFNYAVKFPNEFFIYMDKDSSAERYKRWVEIIAYSGLNDYNKNSNIESDIISKMNTNCSSCNLEIKQRVEKFAKDITKMVKFQE